MNQENNTQREKLALILPYRNRKKHLEEMLPYMEEYLKNYDFKIFVIEQANNLPFNKGILLNIGFKESEDFDYWVFNDIDYLPVDADYSYNSGVTHLAGIVEEYGWKLPHNRFMGGVFMVDRESYHKINGFPNEYWGWGDEDNDIYDRYEMINVPVVRKPGKYRSLKHDRYSHTGLENENAAYRRKLSERFKDGHFTDGYDTLEYTKVSEEQISAHAVLIRATFNVKREIKTSKTSILIKDMRFKLAPMKRAAIKLLLIGLQFFTDNDSSFS